jgi:hypothetical protein
MPKICEVDILLLKRERAALPIPEVTHDRANRLEAASLAVARAPELYEGRMAVSTVRPEPLIISRKILLERTT